nr:MAG: hypothetical protein [Bacteriophage sp.]
MKGLQFLGNRVEDAANAFIDVLKYSDQSVDYPDFKDIEPWPDEIVNMFLCNLEERQILRTKCNHYVYSAVN